MDHGVSSRLARSAPSNPESKSPRFQRAKTDPPYGAFTVGHYQPPDCWLLQGSLPRWSAPPRAGAPAAKHLSPPPNSMPPGLFIIIPRCPMCFLRFSSAWGDPEVDGWDSFWGSYYIILTTYNHMTSIILYDIVF